ncbi:MAG: Na+/H+ antiporter NhaA [Actinomycetales bacterium]
MKRRVAPLRDFLANESASGVILVAAAALGLLAANSPISTSYFDFLSLSFELDFLGIYLSMTVLKFINYALMTIFFFVVGLEIKRELTSGHLSQLKQALAPFIAAIGGMLIPALIYLVIAGDVAPEGWAVPVATDIALAVGVMALMGKRASQGLKAFLLALAVIDDIGAILIIAIVYSSGVVFGLIYSALFAVALVLLMQKFKLRGIVFYIFAGALLWYSLYKAGLHPTLAGVIMGLLTPTTKMQENIEDVEDGSLTLVEKLEHQFHSYSSFLVIPIFAFANSGVRLTGSSIESAFNSPIAWGIIVGLAVGKPAGIYLTSKLAVLSKVAQLPEHNSRSLIATGSTAGIGFTVAIFIAKLAFTDTAIQDLAVTAVIVGSIISALASILLFRFQSKTF